MAKTKRSKAVWLTKTKTKGRELKENLVSTIQNALEKYSYVYVVQVENMRNNTLKEVRDGFPDCKFLFGKNKVMSIALGKDEASETRPNIRFITEKLTGNNVGLLFCDLAPETAQ
eukprot:Sdes_comp21976_c0_seq1m20519